MRRTQREGSPLLHVRKSPSQKGFVPVTLETDRGPVEVRHYRPDDATRLFRGVIWIGGVGGGWDSPAQLLYPRLALWLKDEGYDSLRMRFRHACHLEEAVYDVLAGLRYLLEEGIQHAALVGHAFGAAVAIQVAQQMPVVRTVITLAAQSHGADEISHMAPRSVLLIHGGQDQVLPSSCSEYLFAIAGYPKTLMVLDGAGHNLDEEAERITQEVHQWIHHWL